MTDRNPRLRKSKSEMSSGSSSSTSSFDSDEETDALDLKPIRGYLSNRRELARQLFRSVKSDKIRMMLPQVLKNMNLNELEEWCASELCGMSEARILCILDGQTMLNSSDTSETDDSGPSLEIISDTEEWLTDTDMPTIKEEPSSSSRISKSKRSKPAKSKTKIQGQIRSEKDKSKVRPRLKGMPALPIDSNVRVKKEKEKETRAGTNKEGESLLDLLELEMRARAIRALIRKEEDIIPLEATEKRTAMNTDALRNTLNSAVSASLTDNKRLNLDDKNGNNAIEKPAEESIGKKKDAGEDEDVVFVVVKPTPTIELLSSDGENDDKEANGKNKKDEIVSTELTKETNQRSNKNDKPVAEVVPGDDKKKNERIVTIDKSTDGSDNLKIVVTKRISESSKHTSSPSKASRVKKIDGEKSDKPAATIVDSENDKISNKIVESGEKQSGKGLFKKIRKKQNLRSKRKIVEESSNIVEILQSEKPLEKPSSDFGDALSNEQNNVVVSRTELPVTEAIIKMEIPDKTEIATNESPSTIEEGEIVEKKGSSRPSRVSMDDDKLDDFEEIIDLDDYPDDMDDIENNDQVKKVPSRKLISTQARIECKTDLIANETKIVSNESSVSAETWASRYYQTDDVQNVIKESKIQSEIRKRLRERQRLSKLNSSPKLDSPIEGNSTLEKTDKNIETAATGSVEEYMALKNSTAVPTGIVDNVEISKVNDEEAKKSNPVNGTEMIPEIINK